MKNFHLLIQIFFLFISGFNYLLPQGISTDVCLKSGKSIPCSIMKADTDEIVDSIITNDSLPVQLIISSHNELNHSPNLNSYIIKDSSKITPKTININFELWGKSLVGGVNIGYIHKHKHAFDFGYGNGEASTGLFSHVEVEDLYYFSYAYLFGESNSKFELGSGLAMGNVIFKSGFLSTDTSSIYKSPILSGTIGFRYQKKKTGLFFKCGLTPLLFIKPRAELKLFINIGIGFTVVI